MCFSWWFSMDGCRLALWQSYLASPTNSEEFQIVYGDVCLSSSSFQQFYCVHQRCLAINSGFRGCQRLLWYFPADFELSGDFCDVLKCFRRVLVVPGWFPVIWLEKTTYLVTGCSWSITGIRLSSSRLGIS
jgi:hypothetical protein